MLRSTRNCYFSLIGSRYSLFNSPYAPILITLSASCHNYFLRFILICFILLLAKLRLLHIFMFVVISPCLCLQDSLKYLLNDWCGGNAFPSLFVCLGKSLLLLHLWKRVDSVEVFLVGKVSFFSICNLFFCSFMSHEIVFKYLLLVS